MIAQIGTWKAGGIAVSINPMNRERELAGLLQDSGATVLVCLESLYRDVASKVVADSAVRTVLTTSELEYQTRSDERIFGGVRAHRLRRARRTWPSCWSGTAGRPRRRSRSGPDDVAFLTYTSGTTGPPKGAMNTHRNVVFNAQTYRDWIELDGDDVVLGVAPLFHITGLIGHIAIALLVGAPLVLMYRLDPSVTVDTIRDAAADLHRRVDHGVHRADERAGRRQGRAGQPEEDLLGRRADPAEHGDGVPGHVRALHPQHLRADRDHLAVARGAAGRVAPRSTRPPARCRSACRSTTPSCGSSATTGRTCRPARSASWSPPGRRWWPGTGTSRRRPARALPGGALHTGDVGYMDEAGWFYIVDRKKDQINAGGYKVWPREVEDVLYEHEAVREAAVVGVPDEYRGETVKAFVSLRPGRTVGEDDLIAFCKERMAAYKYPRSIEFLDEIPKTVTGKLLRRELRTRTPS